jgi:hypothetical protein
VAMWVWGGWDGCVRARGVGGWVSVWVGGWSCGLGGWVSDGWVEVWEVRVGGWAGAVLKLSRDQVLIGVSV